MEEGIIWLRSKNLNTIKMEEAFMIINPTTRFYLRGNWDLGMGYHLLHFLGIFLEFSKDVGVVLSTGSSF